ncbi:uncharacterized protein LOC111271468 isoform X2 [Varroa jacobsoni]|uniref:uncharacterized protein LOC111271468 isoform X2 n=1 Tax=Varroa jacobsoni TaxID=62625 RepID=UPI000BF89AFD|nr:uncharacterized protein LOC111271468 isoform X2 [Varroa jacobsoni]
MMRFFLTRACHIHLKGHSHRKGVNKHVRIDKLKNTHKMQFGKAAVAAVDVTFLKEMPAGTKLSITIHKYVLGLYIPLPCMRGKGSCKYDLCEFLTSKDDMCTLWVQRKRVLRALMKPRGRTAPKFRQALKHRTTHKSGNGYGLQSTRARLTAYSPLTTATARNTFMTAPMSPTIFTSRASAEVFNHSHASSQTPALDDTPTSRLMASPSSTAATKIARRHDSSRNSRNSLNFSSNLKTTIASSGIEKPTYPRIATESNDIENFTDQKTSIASSGAESSKKHVTKHVIAPRGKCSCPIRSGLRLKSKMVHVLQLPELRWIPKFIKNGGYTIRAELIDRQGNSLHCSNMRVWIG